MDRVEQGRQQLLELLGEWATRPPDEVLKALTYCEAGVSPSLPLATVIARPDEFRDRLLAEVQKTPVDVARSIGSEPDEHHLYFLHQFAMFLLALWQEQRAFRPLLAYLAADSNAALEQLEETLTEDMHTILARTWDGGDLAPLKALIEDSGANSFVRNACFRCLMTLERMGKYPRSEMVAYAADLLERLRHEGNRDFAPLLMLAAAEIQEADLRPAIDRWYAAKLVDRLMSKANIDEAYAVPFDKLGEELVQFGKFNGLVDYLSDWSWFKKKRPAKHERASDSTLFEFSEPYVRDGRKVGRNEPCPCGSGKKYKKCCLENDLA